MNTQWRLEVEFGKMFFDEGDGFLILPFRENKVNVAHYVYEMILLSLPKRSIHPDLENATMSSEILNLFSRYSMGNIEDKD